MLDELDCQAPQVLTGVRVLDLSRWVAGEYATKLFGDFGADVIKIEKPGEGSFTRRWGPFPGDRPHPERSALFLHLNTNKRSVALDLHEPADRDVLLDLVGTADAMVESFRPGHLERLGVGPDVLLARNPRLVLTRISAFGQYGHYRDYEATGLVLQAMGGPMHATGEAGRAPLRKPGLLEHYTIGRSAGQATMAGLFHARRTGAGAVIDVSGQEVLLSGADRRACFLMSAAYSEMVAPRGVRSAHRHGTTFTGPFRAKDGFVMLYVTTKDFWNRLVNLVGGQDEAFLHTYLDRQTLGDDWDDFLGHVRDWFATRSKLEIMDVGEAARIPLTAYLEISELVAHEHFRGRGAFVRADHPVAGSLEYVGPPWRMANGFRLRRCAPVLDEHGAQIRVELARRHQSTADVVAGTPRALHGTRRATRRPLEGIRVVDLTVVWSGPGATTLLGDLGAEVIRLEGNNRTSRQVSAKVTKEMIAATGYHGGTYPDKDPGPRPYDRTALFNWHARNKLAACVNLETAEGYQAAIELIRISDVLVENNSNGTLEKLGLGHETLLGVNPRLVVARMPPIGMTGPMSNYLGYGPNFNALVGIAAMDGYEGEPPDTAGENYHMDEAAPAGLAFAVLAALWDRERTGLGGLIEFSQAENVMQEIGEFVLDYHMNGRNPRVMGNSDPHLLQDAFLSAEDDRWVVISIRDDRAWAAFSAVVGQPDWTAAGATAKMRVHHSRALRDRMSEWVRRHRPAEIVQRLQAAGVPAGEVMTEDRLLADPHLAVRGWFRQRSHPSVGTHRYPGHPWRAEGFDLVFGRPLPGFGEDNEYVYRHLLGFSAQRYDELVARGLVTDEQLA